VVPGLVSWWQRRGMELPPLGARGQHLRFLCGTCAAGPAAAEGGRWPLPFGGEVRLQEDGSAEELVVALSASGAPSDADGTLEEGSWIAVDAADMRDTASEGSWLDCQPLWNWQED